MKKDRTIMIKAFDKVDRVIGKGMLLASVPVLIPVDTVATSIIERKSPIKSYNKISDEIKRRLNKGEGRGRHFAGANL